MILVQFSNGMFALQIRAIWRLLVDRDGVQHITEIEGGESSLEHPMIESVSRDRREGRSDLGWSFQAAAGSSEEG